MSEEEIKYKERISKILGVEWKTQPCSQSGEECWCRIIIPKEPILDEHGDEEYIIGSGSINKIYAEHLVHLHNESLKK